MMAAGAGLSVARNAAIATSATMVWRMGAGVNMYLVPVFQLLGAAATETLRAETLVPGTAVSRLDHDQGPERHPALEQLDRVEPGVDAAVADRPHRAEVDRDLVASQPRRRQLRHVRREAQRERGVRAGLNEPQPVGHEEAAGRRGR